jgi:hypothetical protein
MLLIHGCHVIETIKIRDRLHVGLRFDQLFGAAVQQADMRIDAVHDLAIKL